MRRREQWRLLMFVFLLGGTVLVMLRVADPEFWSVVMRSLGLDETVEVEGSTPDQGPDKSLDEYTPYVTDSKENPADSVEILSEYQREQVIEGQNRLPGVNLKYLARVQDNAPHRRAERSAWLNLFEQLQNNSPIFLRSAARKDVGYVQLFRQPKEFRGHLVSLDGEVRRVEKMPFGKNPFGIEDLYRLILKVPAGANRPRVLFVFALELPEDFPIEFAMREEVRVTGFSYKKLPYARADGQTEIAPVMLVNGFEWFPEPEPSISVRAVMVATIAIALVVIVGTWCLSRPRRFPVAMSDGKNEAEQTDDGDVVVKLAELPSEE